MTYYGLDGLDRKIEQYLDFDNGVFVEAGANDGENQSNTCYFERSRGWKGVLIEPIPSQFLKCRASRPNSQSMWAAIAPPDWTDPFVELTYCNLMTVTQSSETNLDTDAHVSLGEQFLAPDDRPYKFHAPARTFSSILHEAKVFNIDLLSLDVEGFEIPALRGLDLSTFKVKHLCVETSNITGVMDVLGEGYDIVEKLSYHDYFVRRKA